MVLPTLSATAAAQNLLQEIITDHGPVILHQSGGCCDGSAPMCYPIHDFKIGQYDVLIGKIGDTGFYMPETLLAVWGNAHIILHAIKGRGAAFSLDNNRQSCFITRTNTCQVLPRT